MDTGSTFKETDQKYGTSKEEVIKAITENWDGKQPFGRFLSATIGQTGAVDTGSLVYLSDRDLMDALHVSQKETVASGRN